MASGEVSGAIETFLSNEWSDTPLLFENKNAFEDGDPCPPATPEAFIAVSFTGRSYSQESLGVVPTAGNRWDEDGFLFLDVCVPINTGSSAARTFAKSLVDLFRGLTLLGSDLFFLEASIGEGHRSDRYSGNYFIVPVDIEWKRVESPQT